MKYIITIVKIESVSDVSKKPALTEKIYEQTIETKDETDIKNIISAVNGLDQ